MTQEDVQSVQRTIQAMMGVQNADSTGWKDWRGDARRSGEATTADRNPIEIMDMLTRSLGKGYNPGGSMVDNEGKRVSSATLGFYNTIAKAITTRTDYAGDMSVALHEFGHALQDSLDGLHATQAMIDALPSDVRNAYSLSLIHI